MSLPPSSTEGELAVRWTIRLALLLYADAIVGMLTSGPQPRRDWKALVWATAWLIYAVHVAAAFQSHHGWSLAHPLPTWKRVSGFGPGIFFSYSFALRWGLDAGWRLGGPASHAARRSGQPRGSAVRPATRLGGPASHAARPVWLSRLLHAFFAFILFDGAVVYEPGPMHW